MDFIYKKIIVYTKGRKKLLLLFWNVYELFYCVMNRKLNFMLLVLILLVRCVCIVIILFMWDNVLWVMFYRFNVVFVKCGGNVYDRKERGRMREEGGEIKERVRYR